MSWLMLDDGFLDHPKFVLAFRLGGSEAIHLWLGFRAYCGKQLTDGFVPEHMIADVRGPTDADVRNRSLAALVRAGLVNKLETGLELHDYLQWSKSREKILKERKSLRERVDRHRSVTRYKPVSNGNGNALVPLPLPSPPIRSGSGSRDPISTQKVIASGAELSPQAAPSAHPVELTSYQFPVVGKGAKVWFLPTAEHEAMRLAFPAVDAVAEYRKAFAWLRSNPRRRKTATGMPKFLYAWLEREQNKGHSNGAHSGQRPAPMLPRVEDL